jgi:hypothetical protein
MGRDGGVDSTGAGSEVGSSEQGNESLGSVKGEEFHDQLRECQLLKNCFPLQSYLIWQLSTKLINVHVVTMLIAIFIPHVTSGIIS